MSIGISRGEKFALIGANGAGKSSLLKILTGELPSDSGRVSVRDGVRLGYLTQEPAVQGDPPVKDILFDDHNKVAAVVKHYEEAIHDPHVSPERMQHLLEQMEELKAWDYEARVQEITTKLGVPDLERHFNSLSGGQRKRVFLARLILSEPDLIILDEPTNHLDLEAIEWLESYLAGPSITLIMVTHDRYFLDRVANQIVELDRGKLFTYKGNYAYFLEKKSDREEMQRAEVDKAKNLLRKELDWMRKQPRARGTKAKYRIDAYYELEKKASQDLKKDKLELDISVTRQGGKILELHHVSKSYNGKSIIDPFSYVFKKGDRIGIVGKNGAGKSTFLNLITGRVKPDGGEVIPGVTTKIGYFTQEVADLKQDRRVVEEVKAIAEFITLTDGSMVSASKFLEMFLFPPEKQYTFINKISGGEKKRLQLLKILITNPNFIVLDEPTNDFDIDTLNVLEDFLDKFGGCLVLVSHDRYFMDNLVQQLFIFEGDGKVKVFNGNYSDYRSAEDALEEDESEEVVLAPKPQAAKADKKKATFQERKEHEELQKRLDQLESEKKTLLSKLDDQSLSREELMKATMRIGSIEGELDVNTNRWLELDERINGG